MNAKQKSMFEYAVLLIGLFFMFGFGRVIGPFASVNQVGANILGVFLGVILMTVFTSQTFFASSMGIIAIIYSGFVTASQALASWLGGSIVPQMIFVSALCFGLKDLGIMDIFVKKLLSLKLVQGHPCVFLFALFTASFFIAMFVGFIAAALLMFGIYESVRDVCGYDKQDRFCRFTLLGIYISCFGQFALPFKGVILNNINVFNQTFAVYGFTFNSGIYFMVFVIVSLFFALLMALMMPTVLKCNVTPLKNLDPSTVPAIQAIPDKMDKKQKIVLAGFSLAVIYMIVTPLLPKTFPGYETITRLGTVMVFLLVVSVFSIIKIDGKPLLNASKLLQQGSMWNMLCLVGCFQLLGNAVTSAELGVQELIISVFSPLFGNMSFPLLMLLVCIFVTFLTNFFNGLPLVLACNSAVLPFVCQMAVDTGINPSVMGTILNLCANMAYLTYAGTNNAVLLLDREEINQKWIWSDGIKVLPVYMLVCFLFGTLFSYIL